jgi:CBS domain-containing protein
MRFDKIKASDLMSTDLVCLGVSTPIREAVETLEEYKISGAPVLNEAEELVGVLSASDIVKTEHLEDSRIASGARESHYYAVDPLEDSGDFDDAAAVFSRDEYSDEVLGRETVGDWMTDKVISVPPDATLRDVCRLMARERIHRVFVVEGRRLRGVISTFDIVSFLSGNAEAA